MFFLCPWEIFRTFKYTTIIIYINSIFSCELVSIVCLSQTHLKVMIMSVIVNTVIRQYSKHFE